MEFKYNDSKPYSDNFSTWYGMNTKERIGNGEEPLDSIIAKRKFGEMFGHKVLTEPKFGFKKPIIMLNIVDFPAPLGPSSPNI